MHLTFYESENFSYSSLNHIFEPKNFRFPLFTKISLTWRVNCERLNFRKSQGFYQLDNKLRKVQLNRMVIQKFLVVLEQQKILGSICFPQQIIHRKQWLGPVLLNPDPMFPSSDPKYAFPFLPGGGGGYFWVNVCWACATSLSEPQPHYSLFFGQLQTLSQSLFGKCNFRDPNLVTFYLCIYLINVVSSGGM